MCQTFLGGKRFSNGGYNRDRVKNTCRNSGTDCPADIGAASAGHIYAAETSAWHSFPGTLFRNRRTQCANRSAGQILSNSER